MTDHSVTPSATGLPGGALRALPAAVLVALAVGDAWRTRGSIEAADWLGYAIVASLVLAVAAVSGAAQTPSRRLAGAVLALVGLAAWNALSLRWSATPSLARDEALLTMLYAVALLLPAVTLRSLRSRTAATAAVVLGLAATAVATGVVVARATQLDAVYADGRLDFPVSYQNAVAAFFLVGLWPAIALAARRELPSAVRALSLGGAVALASGWALAQSKGGALGLAVSTVVVFSVSRHRLRLLPPFALAAGLVGAGFYPLTEPYRTNGLAAVHHAARAELVLVAAGVAAGLIYALVDRRVEIGEVTRSVVARAMLLAVVTAVAVGCAVFYARVSDPHDFVAARWQSFKHYSKHDNASTHFASLGSNRYDFWRVALDELRAHPLAGVGSRGFRAAYLQHRHSGETPARAHSVELDSLSETGIVGFALLVGALGLAVAAFARRARNDLVAIGALGAFACWLAHASVDWTWTFPAIGIPLFLLVGTASARDTAARLRTRAAVPVAAAALALALGGFGAPWLAAHYVRAAIRGQGDANSELARAQRLDPLSVDPLLARWALAPSPSAGVQALEEAVRMEPRSPDLLFVLGRQQLLAGDRTAAKATLERALLLDPADPAIVQQLRAAR